MIASSRSKYLVCVSSCVSLLIFIVWPITDANGAEVFSQFDDPLNETKDTWVSKYWNWWAGLSTSEAEPKPGGCLINSSERLVMLMETTVSGIQHQACRISSDQGIMVPMWIAWCDTGDHSGLTDEQLTKCAREEYNLGDITSSVKLDNDPIANLDVRMSMASGSLDYDPKSLVNVTEFSSKGFKITIPQGTQMSTSVPGVWDAGSHGWWVFIKPLSPGHHVLSYATLVKEVGRDTEVSNADITYDFQVE